MSHKLASQDKGVGVIVGVCMCMHECACLKEIESKVQSNTATPRMFN